MQKEINGDRVGIIFKQLGYLLICSSVMGGGAAIVKYSNKISPSFPKTSIVSGVIMVFIGLGLTAFVAAYGMQEITKYYKSKIKGIIYGFFYFYMSAQLAMALFFAATS